MVYALDRGCRYVERLLTLVDRVRHDHAREPAEGSQLAQERAQAHDRVRQHLHDASTLAGLRLVAAEEHLQVLCSVIRSPSTAYSSYTVARGITELSARAWWLLDPALGADSRAERGLLERIYALREEAKIPVPEIKEQAGEDRRSLASQAAAAGLSTNLQTRPASTQLVAEVFTGDPELGETFYRMLSGVVHGTSNALARRINRQDDLPARDGIVTGIVSTDAGVEAHLMLGSLICYTEAINREFALYGWPAGPIDGHTLYTSSELRHVIDAVGDARPPDTPNY